MNTDLRYIDIVLSLLLLFLFLFSLSTNRHRSVVQYTVDSPHTHIFGSNEALSQVISLASFQKQVAVVILSSCTHSDHEFKDDELESIAELSQVCSHIALTCSCSARIGRPDFFLFCQLSARAFTTWIKACDKRLARSVSYIHFTTRYKQYRHV